MFHHCNDPIRFGHFEHLELPRCCIVTWHLLAAKSKLVENFEPSSEYSLWCWQQRKIVSEYSQLACEWFLPWQEIRLYGLSYPTLNRQLAHKCVWQSKFRVSKNWNSLSKRYKELPMTNKNLAPKLTYLRKLYAPWQLLECPLGRFTRSIFLSQLLLKLKEVNDANQHFYELKQNQKNNWIHKNGSRKINRSIYWWRSLKKRLRKFEK